MADEKQIQITEFPYFITPNAIYDYPQLVIDNGTERAMTGNERVVLIYLIRCCNNGKSGFPSYNKIALRCGISRRTAVTIIKVLEDNYYILKKTRGYTQDKGGNVKRQSNVYVVNTDRIFKEQSE